MLSLTMILKWIQNISHFKITAFQRAVGKYAYKKRESEKERKNKVSGSLYAGGPHCPTEPWWPCCLSPWWQASPQWTVIEWTVSEERHCVILCALSERYAISHISSVKFQSFSQILPKLWFWRWQNRFLKLNIGNVLLSVFWMLVNTIS